MFDYLSRQEPSVPEKKEKDKPGGSKLGSAIKNLGLFSKSPGDFKMETMDF